eukprot:639999-Pyramimonas_sp.AAC.1
MANAGRNGAAWNRGRGRKLRAQPPPGAQTCGNCSIERKVLSPRVEHHQAAREKNTWTDSSAR